MYIIENYLHFLKIHGIIKVQRGMMTMGVKDTITKEYMQNAEIFADAFNFLMYGGEQVIQPECLHELDTSAIALPYGDDDVSEPVQKTRDVLKSATMMADDNAAYLILGIENQTDVHYAMPARNMLYDAIQYAKQISDAAKSHKNAKNTGDSKEEYLSGFYRTDKLLPVVTLVVYFGANEWDAPRSIHDMMLVKDERILAYAPDYKINLIAPNELTDEEMAKFRTDLRAVLKYIKYSKDKEKLMTALHEDIIFRSVSRSTAEVINIVTNSTLTFDKKEESIDMCKAIEDIKADGIAEGKAEGIAEAIRNLMESLKIDEAKAKELLGIPQT